MTPDIQFYNTIDQVRRYHYHCWIPTRFGTIKIPYVDFCLLEFLLKNRWLMAAFICDITIWLAL